MGAILRADDTLVVWRPDRPGRALKDLIVRESVWLGNRVADVAQRYGLHRRQLPAWPSLPRRGEARPLLNGVVVEVAPHVESATGAAALECASAGRIR